jgi:hypothetical protein
MVVEHVLFLQSHKAYVCSFLFEYLPFAVSSSIRHAALCVALWQKYKPRTETYLFGSDLLLLMVGLPIVWLA